MIAMSASKSSMTGSTRRRLRAIQPSGAGRVPALGSPACVTVTGALRRDWLRHASAASHPERLLPLFLGAGHLLGDLLDRRADHLDLRERLGAGGRRHVGGERLLEICRGQLGGGGTW